MWRDGDTHFTIPVPDGDYVVHLHNVETSAGIDAAGGRLFSVDINESRRITDWDLYDEAGGQSRALIRSLPVSVVGSELRITLIRNIRSPKLCGLEILSPWLTPLPVTSTPLCDDEHPCPADGLSLPRCSGNEVRQTRTSFACIDGQCVPSTSDELVVACAAGNICQAGGCVPDTPVLSLREALIYDHHFLMPEDAVPGDAVGLVNYYDLPNANVAYSILAGDADATFAISSPEGLLTVADATGLSFAQHPRYELLIQAHDATQGITEQATVTITVSEVSKTVFIDPASGGGASEDGSRGHPYDSWGDVVPEAGLTYLQRRGTVFNSQIRVAKSGTAESPISIGAYGVGPIPVLDGANYADGTSYRGVYIGNHTVPSAYVYVYDLEVRNFPSYGVETAPRGHHNRLYNLYLHHSGRTAGELIPGVYVYNNTDDWDEQLYNELSNCRSEYNREHGFKTAAAATTGSYLVARHNGGAGIHNCQESRNNHIFKCIVSDNHGGLTSVGLDNLIEDVISHGNNRYGFITSHISTGAHFKNCVTYGNAQYGILIAENASHAIFEDVEIYGNGVAGVRAAGQTQDIVLDRLQIHDNVGQGLLINETTDCPDLNTGISLRYSLVYNNGAGVRVEDATDVRILNVTFFDNTADDVSVAADSSNVLVRNTILSAVAGTAAQDHDIYLGATDPLFADSARDDFRLMPLSPAVDAGVDVGLSVDLIGTPVPQGSQPDIGAYELVQ